MARDPAQPRYGAANATRRDHLARLRQRLERIKQSAPGSQHPVLGLIAGILDLLEDDE